MSRRLIVLLIAISAVLFVLLAFLAHNNTPLPGDEAIARWLQGFQAQFLDSVLRTVSFLAETWPTVITVAILALILLIRRRFLEMILIIAVPTVVELLNYLLKMIVDRPRPGADLTGGGLSFPSGHATYAMAFFGFLFFLTPRFIKNTVAARITQAVLALLIVLGGAARIYVGKHWPSDILGSYLFGGTVLLVAALIYKSIRKEEDIA